MRPDLLVAANPVWETAWIVDRLPVERFKPDGFTVPVEDGGGSALNTACALACAGWRVTAAGRVGDDREGMACLAALRCRGVEDQIEVVAGRRTKQNRLYVERITGATAFETTLPERAVEPWEGSPPDLETSRFLLLDRLVVTAGIWLRARRGRPGLMNGLNRNTPGLHGWNDPRLLEALPDLDYLQIPEAAAPVQPQTGPVTDRRRIHRPRPFDPLTRRQADSLIEAGVRILVRTRGSSGAILQGRGVEPVAIPAAATEVVDPTGAGDAFAAGFLDCLLRGEPVAEAARRGTEWAARACRHLGARGWLDHEPPGTEGGPQGAARPT